MKEMKRNIFILLLAGVLSGSCEDQFSPADNNHLTFEEVYRNASVAEGLLLNAYGKIPNIYGYNFNDVATDDAVSNDKGNGYRRMAQGEWSAMMNPMDCWGNCLSSVFYMNQLIGVADQVDWAPRSGETMAQLFYGRNVGEAYALRAYMLFCALQAHAGYNDQGELLGVPLFLESPDKVTDLGRPRETVANCLKQIYVDFAEAEKYLALDFGNITDESKMPKRYADIGATVDEYNRVFGDKLQLRITSRIVKGLRSRVATWAASPVYNQETLANAANYAAESLNLIGGIEGLDPQGALFYLGTNVDKLDLDKFVNQKEILWRGGNSKTSDRESDNFPPTLYGKGRVNPTQNLVDAFPMQNGYPITDRVHGGYDASAPYAKRDPRLANYVVFNGSKVSGKVISIEEGDNAVNALATSTRTGYYLRKLLRDDVNLNPNSVTTQKHYPVVIRYTEIFLNYAEAANEAWGPDGKGGNAYSAREVIAAIRKRAGIDQPDGFLSSITGRENMAQLIRNERRLELCFESTRFWDLRRWGSTLNEAALGISVKNGVYGTPYKVEERAYEDYMHHGPIPYQEVLKFKYSQNKGW